ncbi:hypothetical protein OAK38_06020 [Verrucomicrobia bacterium]|nr:hypothetical protein [Verrucomicrobiota bacterium]
MTNLSVQTSDQKEGKSPVSLVTPKQIRETAKVSGRTVRRWAKQFDWRTHRVNDRVLRYNREDVEKTIGSELQ